jgi:carboxyl-terminal processing protease
MVVLAVSAAMIFWAGLSLGGRISGRDDGERSAIEAFTETYRRINAEFVGESEPGELLEGAIEGMFETLDDPYSTYMGPDEYESTFASINGEFEGIGARMNTEDPEGITCEPISDACQLRVIEVLPETPALGAGLLAGDIVRAVDGRVLDGQTIDDAVMLIRGPRDSEVVLSLEREGEERDLAITRDTIVSQDVRSAILADGDIGYLRIDGFSARASDDFEDALKVHIEAGIDKLVIDVRDDPGGFVDTAVEITSEFLADGAVFWEENAEGAQRSIDVISGGLATDDGLDLVVLIDDGTASASEILAGALQDAGRAELVGERSFGKGTVQEWTQLPSDNGGFRLSIAKWLTRDKTWIDGTGLTPDSEVADSGPRFQPDDPDADPAADAQLQRGITLLLGDDLAAAGVEPAVVPTESNGRVPDPSLASTPMPLPSPSAPTTAE